MQPFGNQDLVILWGWWWMLCCALAVMNDGKNDKEKSAGIEEERFDCVLCALFHGFTASCSDIFRSDSYPINEQMLLFVSNICRMCRSFLLPMFRPDHQF